MTNFSSSNGWSTALIFADTLVLAEALVRATEERGNCDPVGTDGSTRVAFVDNGDVDNGDVTETRDAQMGAAGRVMSAKGSVDLAEIEVEQAVWKVGLWLA